MAQAAPNLYPHSQPQQKADVLLVTVTEIEAKAVLKLFPGHDVCFLEPGGRPYFDLGIVSDTRVFMVQSAEMGVTSVGGALMTVLEALLALSPTTIIMVGIAYGVDPVNQKIGDILVSTKICDCGRQRIGTDGSGNANIRSRGDRIPAPPHLQSKFRAGAKAWTASPKVHFGPILSVEKLIDNLEYRNQLLKLEPDAIGGEMEGVALTIVEQRRRVDWILVKAICDWADGHKGDEKEKRQEEAADNAAKFALHVIRQGGLSPAAAQANVPTPPIGTKHCSYDEHAHRIIALSWEPGVQGGQRIASTGSDGTVRIWDAETAQHFVTYRGHQYQGTLAKTSFLPTLYNVVWSPVDAHIASCGDGTEVHVCNAESGGTIRVYRGHSGLLAAVFAIDWSPDGQYIASACSSAGIDKTIHIWDVRTGQTVRRLSTHGGLFPNFSMLALAWSPDGSRIAATCDNHTILLLNSDTGERIASYRVSASSTSHLTWSPDGRFLAAANSNKTLQVWDTSTHRLIHTYDGHTDSVRAVAWSPDGTRLASASNDKTVRIWSFSSDGKGTHLFTYDRHKDWTTSVAWSPDGTRIASGSNDKTVHIWQAI